MMDCPKCNGNGEIETKELAFLESKHGPYSEQCVYCSGTGYMETNE